MKMSILCLLKSIVSIKYFVSNLHRKLIENGGVTEQKILMRFLSHNIPKRNKLAEKISQKNPDQVSDYRLLGASNSVLELCQLICPFPFYIYVVYSMYFYPHKIVFGTSWSKAKFKSTCNKISNIYKIIN
jgi:hypothetical protein